MAIFEFPLLCPLKPVPQSDVLPSTSSSDIIVGYNPAYNTRDMDADFYKRTLNWYENDLGYLQPYQQSEVIRIPWLGSDTTLANYQYARLLDQDGKVFTGKTVTVVQESGTWAGKKLYTVTIPLYDVPEGYYFVQLRHKSGSEYLPILFEPIHVKQVHPYTVLIEAYHTKNDWGMVWPSAAFKFQLRVKGSITEVTPKAKITAYENQPLDYEILYGMPSREYEATFFRIPVWAADKINRLTLCNTITIDGKGLSRQADAELKPATAKAPLSDYSLIFRERDNSLTFDRSHNVTVVCDMPQTSLFWIEKITYAGVPTTVNVRRGFEGKRNFLDYLNSTFPITNGAWMENDRDQLIMQGDWTEPATILAADILPYGLRFNMSGTGYFKTTFYKGAIAGTTYYALEFSDGSASTNRTSYTGSPLINKNFSTNRPNHWVKMYFSDVERIDDAGIEMAVKSIKGDFAKSLTDFQFYLTDSLIERFENNPFKFVNAGTFHFLWLQNQNLDTFAVDDIIRWLYESLDKLDPGADIFLDSQALSAPPSTNDPGMLNIISKIRAAVTNFQTD